jgi:hypothetical protein
MPEIAAGATPFLGDIDAEEAEFAGASPQCVPDMPALAGFGISAAAFPFR